MSFSSCAIGQHRCWLQGNEEIFLHIATSAMGFQILRSHGYDVSSGDTFSCAIDRWKVIIIIVIIIIFFVWIDALTQFAEEDQFCNTLKGCVKDAGSVLELYRASELIVNDNEIILEKINSWTSDFLRKGLLAGEMHAVRLEDDMHREVDFWSRFSPYYCTKNYYWCRYLVLAVIFCCRQFPKRNALAIISGG